MQRVQTPPSTFTFVRGWFPTAMLWLLMCTLLGLIGRVVAAEPTIAESTTTGTPNGSIADANAFDLFLQRSGGTEPAQKFSSPDPSPNVHNSVDAALERRGSITFRKTPLNEVVFLLSDLWKVNIVVSNDVNSEVNGTFQDAPLREVLTSVLSTIRYGYRQMGNSIIVLPDDQLGSNRTSVSSGAMVQSGIAYFTPQFTNAEMMGEALQMALGDTVIVAVFAEENRIMIKGTQDELRLATEAIEQLDIPRPQVRITALIYDVGLKELEGLGVTWSQGPRSHGVRVLEGDAAGDGATEIIRNVATTAVNMGLNNPTGTINLRSLSNTYEAEAFLQALDATSEAKILADPSITVADRKEASIKIVQRIPIQAVESAENSLNTIAQIEFVDAGIILNVTPRISRDGTIELQVRPEYSVVTDYIQNNPVIDSRTAETTVRVQNGHTFVLGGLRQKTVNETVQGVPWLKDMKYIGALFRSHNTEVVESELIVFLKPEIVTPYEIGQPRELKAACITQAQLNAIPYATICPQAPYCKNKYCPNHHPRARHNGGSIELNMLGGGGIGCSCSEYGLYEEDEVDLLIQSQ